MSCVIGPCFWKPPWVPATIVIVPCGTVMSMRSEPVVSSSHSVRPPSSAWPLRLAWIFPLAVRSLIGLSLAAPPTATSASSVSFSPSAARLGRAAPGAERLVDELEPIGGALRIGGRILRGDPGVAILLRDRVLPVDDLEGQLRLDELRHHVGGLADDDDDQVVGVEVLLRGG